MTTTHRMLPSPVVDEQTRVVNGRSYTGTPGSTFDIVECDADALEANGWTFVALSGPTSARPLPALTPIGPDGTQAGPGEKYFDTTLNAIIFCDGATWRSPVDGSAV